MHLVTYRMHISFDERRKFEWMPVVLSWKPEIHYVIMTFFTAPRKLHSHQVSIFVSCWTKTRRSLIRKITCNVPAYFFILHENLSVETWMLISSSVRLFAAVVQRSEACIAFAVEYESMHIVNRCNSNVKLFRSYLRYALLHCEPDVVFAATCRCRIILTSANGCSTSVSCYCSIHSCRRTVILNKVFASFVIVKLTGSSFSVARQHMEEMQFH